MIKTKECPICGKTFSYNPRVANAFRFCSNPCRNKHLRDQRAAVRQVRIRLCPICGSSFDQDTTITTNQKYCSERCRHDAAAVINSRRRAIYRTENKDAIREAGRKYRAENREKRRNAKRNYRCRKTETCRYCGEVYRPKDRKLNTFCSRECAYSLRRERSLVRQARIQAEVKARVEARTKARMKRQALIAEARAISICADCGTEYVTGKRITRRCALCREAKSKARIKAERKTRRSLGLDDRGKHRKRARRLGLAYETVSPHKVFERDGWHCQLCLRPIERGTKAPHPLSASIDRIIPMAKGGPHVYANVQTAHFKCNWLKGDRPINKLQFAIEGLNQSVSKAPNPADIEFYVRKFRQPRETQDVVS